MQSNNKLKAPAEVLKALDSWNPELSLKLGDAIFKKVRDMLEEGEKRNSNKSKTQKNILT